MPDNALDRAQVEPLCPPAGCLLLVTSRQRFTLPGLVGVNLDALPEGEAVALLRRIAPRALPLVLCHSDLHGKNVRAGADDALAVIDWDEPILAPKERDLMFIGGGVWNQEQQAAWFYDGYDPGYGQAAVDPQALACYRYERIVEDLVAYGQRILDRKGSAEDREDGLRRLATIFDPGNVVEMAHRAMPQRRTA